MLRIVRTSLLSLTVLNLIAVVPGLAQTTQEPAAKRSPSGVPGGSAAPAGAPATAVAGMAEVVATVTSQNQADKVTKGEVLDLLSRNPLPPASERDGTYRDAVDILVNTHLLNRFLARQNIPVTPARIDEELDRLKGQLKKDGQDLPTLLLQNKGSMDELRKVFENRIRWTEFLKLKASDATLKKYLADHRDLFSGTQVRASHILLRVDSSANAAEKEKIKQKLLGIRNDVLQGKLGFAEAANKYSEDPANAGGAGGDLDYFTLASGIIEEFANVAFKLRKGEISQPVETEFGYHLIQVTDRREGKPPEFEQNKPYVLNAYAAELQKTVLAAERKTAQIEVKPMPRDLFPAEQPAATPTDAAGGAATTKGTGLAVPK